MRAAAQIAEPLEPFDDQSQHQDQPPEQQAVGLVMADVFHALLVLGQLSRDGRLVDQRAHDQRLWPIPWLAVLAQSQRPSRFPGVYANGVRGFARRHSESQGENCCWRGRRDSNPRPPT